LNPVCRHRVDLYEKHPFVMPSGKTVYLCIECCRRWYRRTKHMRAGIRKVEPKPEPTPLRAGSDMEARLQRMIERQERARKREAEQVVECGSKRLSAEAKSSGKVPLELSRKRLPKEDRAKRRDIPKRVIRELYEDQAGICVFCRAPLEVFEVDHIIPIARGGDNRKENLQLLCKKCNQEKRDKNPAVFMLQKGIIDRKTLFILGYRGAE
jgi:hypothetical protein